MQGNTAKESSEPARASGVAVSEPPPRRLFTLSKFAERHSSFTTLAALTNQVFKSRPRRSSKGLIPGNGMLDYGVVIRINSRVLIDESAYFRWVDARQPVNSQEDRAPATRRGRRCDADDANTGASRNCVAASTTATPNVGAHPQAGSSIEAPSNPPTTWRERLNAARRGAP